MEEEDTKSIRVLLSYVQLGIKIPYSSQKGLWNFRREEIMGIVLTPLADGQKKEVTYVIDNRAKERSNLRNKGYLTTRSSSMANLFAPGLDCRRIGKLILDSQY